MKSQKEKAEYFKSLHERPVNVMADSSFSVTDLENAGVKRISLGSLLIRAALGEFIRSAKEIQEKGTSRFADKAVPFGKLMKVFKD